MLVMTDRRQRSSALVALQEGHTFAALRLAQAQASFGGQGEVRNAGVELLVHACECDCPAMAVQVLVKDGDVNGARARDGLTPLTAAAIRGSMDLLAVLLGHPSLDINLSEGRSSRTALHFACMHGRAPLVATLLEHAAKIDAVASCGRTPLYVAAERGCLGCVEVLLRQGSLGVSDVYRATTRCSTPIMVAQRRGHMPVAKLLSSFVESLGGGHSARGGVHMGVAAKSASSNSPARAPTPQCGSGGSRPEGTSAEARPRLPVSAASEASPRLQAVTPRRTGRRCASGPMLHYATPRIDPPRRCPPSTTPEAQAQARPLTPRRNGRRCLSGPLLFPYSPRAETPRRRPPLEIATIAQAAVDSMTGEPLLEAPCRQLRLGSERQVLSEHGEDQEDKRERSCELAAAVNEVAPASLPRRVQEDAVARASRRDSPLRRLMGTIDSPPPRCSVVARRCATPAGVSSPDRVSSPTPRRRSTANGCAGAERGSSATPRRTVWEQRVAMRRLSDGGRALDMNSAAPTGGIAASMAAAGIREQTPRPPRLPSAGACMIVVPALGGA